MKSGGTALVLLLVYMVFVFLASRVFDIFVWWQYGMSSTQIFDPILLSVKQLKQLLDVRGLKYTGVVEKKELVELVQESGNVTVGEVDALGETKGPGAAEFSGARHLYEQVEDTKDSAWLVQVGSHLDGRLLLDDLTWQLVRHQLAPFSIQTGILDCSLAPRLCASKGWYKPLLLLAVPRGNKPKDVVFMSTSTYARPQAIVDWLRQELSSRIKRFSSLEEAEEKWLSSPSGNTTDFPIKVLLLTHLLNPPLFLASLTIKFAGRISFGMVTVKKNEETSKVNKVPTYLIITPERTITYGKRKMEHFNFESMNLFLRAVQPEMNDLFVCSLVLVNMFAVIYCFQVKKESWWRIVTKSVLKLVFFNFILFGMLLIIACRWRIVMEFGDFCATVLRRITLSDFGALVRTDWLRLMDSPWLFITSLLIFSYISVRILKLFHIPSTEESGRSWWDFLFWDRQPTSEEGVEALVIDFGDGLDMILEQFVMPDIWLRQEMVPPGYIALLPSFKFSKDKAKDSPLVVEAIMDDQENGFPNRISQCERVDSIAENSLKITRECSICLEKYRNYSLVTELPCMHRFHQKCIVTWLERDNHHCPLCRWPAYKPRADRKNN